MKEKVQRAVDYCLKHDLPPWIEVFGLIGIWVLWLLR